MKILRILSIVAVLVLLWLAWAKLPGLRTKVRSTVDEYGGWTEEARREDPVGFLDFAEAKLSADIETFRTSRQTLLETRDMAQAEHERNGTLLAAATSLAARFRESYRSAGEEESAWPVEVEGARYSRDELLAQVQSILTEEAAFARAVEIYQEVVVSAEKQRGELRTRIQTTEATLVELRAQRELVRVQKLTAEADELLAQVDDLLGKNRARIEEMDEPVRSVEDLLSADREPTGSTPGEGRALEYLEGN